MISSSLKWRPLWTILLIALLGISNLSMIQINPYDLLSDDDLALEQSQSEGQALISLTHQENPSSSFKTRPNDPKEQR